MSESCKLPHSDVWCDGCGEHLGDIAALRAKLADFDALKLDYGKARMDGLLAHCEVSELRAKLAEAEGLLLRCRSMNWRLWRALDMGEPKPNVMEVAELKADLDDVHSAFLARKGGT